MLGLTEISWFPVWLADLWRIALWFVMGWCIVIFAYVLPLAWRRRAVHRASLFGMSSIAAFMLIGLLLTAQNAGQPLALEGAPLTTVAVVFALLCLRALRRELAAGRD